MQLKRVLDHHLGSPAMHEDIAPPIAVEHGLTVVYEHVSSPDAGNECRHRTPQQITKLDAQSS